MKSYEEKEKELNIALKRLGSIVARVSTMNEDIQKLSLHKNQLISEKEETQKKYQVLLKEHNNLKLMFQKTKEKLDNQSKIDEKIDELNQETEGLIEEIEKW